MIIIDKPYVSEFLKESLERHNLPVLQTKPARELLGKGSYNFVEPEELIRSAQHQRDFTIYTPSENSIAWISEHLAHTALPDTIDLFKDKHRFRELISSLYPGFFYQKIRYKNLKHTDISRFPLPFIIKPAVGFFSMGVYKVSDYSQWSDVVEKIETDVEAYRKIYPEAVLDTTSFIAEEIIEGDEYAFDAYFDENGNPVILGIMKHIFSSANDVSDRVYYTSAQVIEENVAHFEAFLRKISDLTELRNFPLHTEVRIDAHGAIRPIEINPLRFGGWCTSADLMHHAFNFNPYEYVCHRKKPDWKELVKNAGDKYYSIIILDNPTGYTSAEIERFDFDKLLKQFENPLELRKVDFKRYPQFGFLFTETSSNNFTEIETILKSDLKSFIVLK